MEEGSLLMGTLSISLSWQCVCCKNVFKKALSARRVRYLGQNDTDYIWGKRFYSKDERTFFFYSVIRLNALFFKDFQLQVEIFANNKFYYFREYVNMSYRIVKRNLQFIWKKSLKNSKKRLEFLKF